MTLVLTEASPLGIAMAADSAARFPDGQVLFGLQKLIPVRSLNAGISFWGAASIVQRQQRMDVWLQNFIRTKVKDKMTLWQVAEVLADSLNSVFGNALMDNNINSGVHLAGFDISKDGRSHPAIYHVHNGHLSVQEVNGKIVHVSHEPVHEFRPNKDVPPEPVAQGKGRILRNGDIALYVILFEFFNNVFRRDLQPKLDIAFPHPATLETRGEHLRFWINFVGQIYRLSSLYPRQLDVPVMGGGAHIGGPISVLTIDSQGIRSFYSV